MAIQIEIVLIAGVVAIGLIVLGGAIVIGISESGDSDGQAAALVRGAWSANEHVPAILTGTKPPVISDDSYVTMVVRTRRPLRRGWG
jgi:hypothetical protein